MSKIYVNNVGLFYKQQGEGHPVVFLHGYTGSSDDFSNQIPLVSTKYKTIAIDHRGHGQSEAPENEEAYAIDIFSEDVYALLKELKIDKCCLVGHSMGGFIALQFILDHPDMVAALVLMDTSSGEWDVTPEYIEHKIKLNEIAETGDLEAVFEYDATHNPQRIERFKRHPEHREIVKKRVMGTSVPGYIYTSRSFAKWTPVTNRLHEITVPTLIFLGEEDTPFFKSSRILRESIKGSQFVMVPGADHSPQEDKPDFVNEKLMTFLKKAVSH